MDADKLEKKKNVIGVKLVPTCLLTLLYIFDMISDISVAVHLYKIGPSGLWGSCVTAVLVCLPILVYSVIEVTHNIKIDKCSPKQSGLLLLKCFFCPFIALIRYSEKIFWLVEVFCVTSTKEQNEAQMKVTKPHRIEIFMFLRPFLQALPQCFLQMFLMIYLADLDARMTQALSTITSVLSVTVVATSYQRYESHEDTTMPWSYNEPTKFSTSPHDSTDQDMEFVATGRAQFYVPTETDIKTEALSNGDVTTPLQYLNTNEIEPETSPSQSRPPSEVTDCSEYVVMEKIKDEDPPPIPPRNSAVIAPARPPSKHIQSSEDNQIKPCDVTEAKNTRVSFLRHSSYSDSNSLSESFRHKRRSSYHYLPISTGASSSNRSSQVKSLSVPDFPAPPIPTSSLIVALPTRKKGRKYVRKETPIAYIVSFLKWFLFLGSRIIALSGLIALRYNYLVIMLIALVLLIIHIAVMNIVISVNCNKKTKCWWKTFLLSIASVFCLLEIGVKLEKFSRTMAIYWPLCCFENIVTGVLAYRPIQVTDVTEWWFIYLFYTLITMFVLSTFCFLFNTYIILPETYIVYNDQEENVMNESDKTDPLQSEA